MNASVKRIQAKSGSWFAVPLPAGGYAIGVVARASKSGILLGYFFGPRRGQVPNIDAVEALRASDAILVGMFGHLGIRGGTWPLIGQPDGWGAEDWPMPVFKRYEELTGRSFMVHYDEGDPSGLTGEQLIAPGEEFDGPADGMMGAGFVEERLDRLLS